MSELLAQTQQLLARVSSQPLIATQLSLSQMVTYLFVIGALESWKVQKCEV